MSRVEIACFTTPEDAELAAEFLRLHGVKASIPVDYFPRRWVTPPTRVFAEQSQAEVATKLFRKVLAGEFAEADPYDNSPEGVGAALAEAVLPAEGFRAPSRLEGLAPVIAILAVGLTAFVGRVVYQLMTGAS